LRHLSWMQDQLSPFSPQAASGMNRSDEW